MPEKTKPNKTERIKKLAEYLAILDLIEEIGE
jgi:hypothetical protein